MFLVAFGLIMLYSTSSYQATVRYGTSTYYLARQFIFVIVGFAAMFVVSRIPYRLIRKLSSFAYIASVTLILLIIPFGYESGGAKRWISIGSFFNIQPSEVAKLGIIIFSAALLERIGRQIKTWEFFLLPFVPAGIVAVMVWKITDNLSTAIIIMAIVFGMLFVACPYYKRFIALAAAVIAVGGAWILITVSTADAADLDFRGGRILAWLNPQAYSTDTAYQTLQGLYAIGSGGLTGKGLGESLQKLGYIPEAQNDMIFSIICEELGLFGAIMIITMFVILIWRFMIIAYNARELYGALLTVGIMTQMAVQVILNIAVVTNTLPNTGVTLPFISYGGSSVVILLVEVGIVMNVSRDIGAEDTSRAINPGSGAIKVGTKVPGRRRRSSDPARSNY